MKAVNRLLEYFTPSQEEPAAEKVKVIAPACEELSSPSLSPVSTSDSPLSSCESQSSVSSPLSTEENDELSDDAESFKIDISSQEAIIKVGFSTPDSTSMNSAIDNFAAENGFRIRKCSHHFCEALTLKFGGISNFRMVRNCTVRCSRRNKSCSFYLYYHYDKLIEIM